MFIYDSLIHFHKWREYVIFIALGEEIISRSEKLPHRKHTRCIILENTKDKRMIILYAVPISLKPMLGKENRFIYTRLSNNNDRWVKHISDYKKRYILQDSFKHMANFVFIYSNRAKKEGQNV